MRPMVIVVLPPRIELGLQPLQDLIDLRSEHPAIELIQQGPVKPSRVSLLAMLRTTWVEDEHISTNPNERGHLSYFSPSAEFVIIIAALSRGCYRVIVVWKFR